MRLNQISLFFFALLLVFPRMIPAQTTQVYYFSPGTSSEKQVLSVPFSVQDSRYIKSWHFIVTDANGKVVRTVGQALPEIVEKPDNWKEILAAFFRPKESVSVPKTVVWDGKNDSGAKCPDGVYFFYFTATDDKDNYRETPRFRVELDTTPPVVTVTQPSAAAKTFGDRAKPSLGIGQSGSREALWTAEVKNEAGKVVRNFQWRDAAPSALAWDGKDNQGITLDDGLYSYSISAIDAAGNRSVPAGVTDIRLESITPEAEAGRSVAELAPNGRTKRQTFSLKATLRTGIEKWSFIIVPVNESGAAPVQGWNGSGDTLRQQIDWNGRMNDGTIAEGQFKGILTISYAKGNVVTTETPPFLCTGLAPSASLTTTPRLFSPDGDGENDVLSFNPQVKSVLPLAAWTLVISDPNGKPFKTWTGISELPAKIDWNGRSEGGELVESAMDYPWTFMVIDTQEQVTALKGSVPIDVLVLKEGDRYVLRVPAIIFRANNADFVGKAEDWKRGLEDSVVENNIRVLTRVAEILQKFSGYRVKIEGHANSETGTEKEEVEQLVPLSQKRAEFVRNWLIENGVAASRLSVEGVGGRRPVMKNRKDRDNWWKNRRVEFILQK